ncbi:MAG: 50S ribosomal protein L23 [Acidobacteria bacterium]|nr:50S ribosomal protein L23 [Acidobacteriota bacterium]
MNSHDVIRRPVITEKATLMKEDAATLCFEVDRRATAIDVRRAVEDIFKVKVDNVRVMNVHGKPKRLGRHAGYQSSWKKAYVRLAAGETMVEYFEGV